MIDPKFFDESAVTWQPLPGPDGSPADHIGMSILSVDDKAKIIDVLFKFAANEKIIGIGIHLTSTHLSSKESTAFTI